VKKFAEQVLGLEKLLGFPFGYGLDFEFAIPDLKSKEVYSIQTAPMPITKTNITIEEVSSPIVTYGSGVGAGARVFRNWAFVPEYQSVGTGNHFEGIEINKALCHYDPALASYNEKHKDYLLFILPDHLFKGNITLPNGTFRFTNTYNAGGVVEAMEYACSHDISEGASHFANFMRCIGQLFISGEPTPLYKKLKGNLEFKAIENRLIIGEGEVYMAVDENAKKGVLDLRKIDKVSFYGV
jgi:hypothetical protein